MGVYVKRALYAISTLVEMVALVGAYLLNHYARSKLGMNRWLGYHNDRWEEGLPIPAIEAVVAIVLILLALTAVMMLKRRKQVGAIPIASVVISCALTVVTCAFVALNTTADFRAYYLMAICFAIATALQLAKSFVFIRQP